MGRRSLPNGFWTDLDGLIKIYQEDFEIAKKLDNTITEIDFINVKALPDFEKLFMGKTSFPPQKMAYKKMIDFLQNRVAELKQAEAEKDDDRIYFIKDGKRQMSGFDWITEIEKARGEINISDKILPTHNFEMLKAHRLKNVFEPEKAKLIEENRINKMDTDEADIKLLYIQFLKDELKYADDWTARISNLRTKILYKADLIQIEKYKVFISEEIKKQEATIKLPPPKKQSISFVWKDNAEIELPKLHQRLVKAEMIDDETDLEAFTATFTGQPTANIKPIKWIEDTVLLAYLLRKEFKGNSWAKIAEKTFIDKQDLPVKANTLSSLLSQSRQTPKGKERIDKILSEIKKH